MAEIGRVLRQNWRSGEREGVPYAYTCPSPGHYPYQWYWDSCFAAISWSHFEPERGREELRSLLRAQREDGFIGHTIFWGAPVSLSRGYRYNVVRRRDHTTATIQPPLLAWAWERVAAASGADAEAFVNEGLEPLERHYDWLARERDLDGDGLLTIIQPDESGLDASPAFDSVWGRRCAGLPGFPLLVMRNRRMRFEARAIAQRTGEHVKEVLTNVLYALGLAALARLGGGDRFSERATAVAEALQERCYDESSGLYNDLAGDDGRPLRVNTWSSLAPLALPDLPEACSRRLVEEQLLERSRYRTAVPIPSVASSEPSFEPGYSAGRFPWRLRRYWRGPTWVNTAWLLVPAMRRLGYDEAADELLVPLLDAMEREGLREYYHAVTGEGLGAVDFGWSSLAVELFEAG